MSNWLRKKLERLHLLRTNPIDPPRLVIRQVLVDVSGNIHDLNNECAMVIAERLLFERGVRQALSANNLTVDEFFREDNQQARTWKILFTQQEVVVLVRHQYASQIKELRDRYGQLPRTYDDNDLNQVLLQKFRDDFKTKIFGIESDTRKLIKDLTVRVHQAIETGDPQQIISALTRLLMPAESIQEVRGFLSASPVDLFKAETERQEREAREKARLKQREDDEKARLKQSPAERPPAASFRRVESQDSNTQEGLSKMPMSSSSVPAPVLKRDKVFISYSHVDAQWLKLLKTHLKPFERKGVVKRWDDTEIKSGQIWKDEIKKAIQSAKVVILLITPDFLASDFIANDELPPLLKAAETEGATILSLIINPSSFIHHEDIAKYQSINPPNKTLAKMSTADRHEVFSSLTSRIIEILNEG